MTLAERILIRWLAALSSGVSAVSAVLVGIEGLDQMILIAVLVASAFLSAMVAALTTETGSSVLGVRRGG